MVLNRPGPKQRERDTGEYKWAFMVLFFLRVLFFCGEGETGQWHGRQDEPRKEQRKPLRVTTCTQAVLRTSDCLHCLSSTSCTIRGTWPVDASSAGFPLSACAASLVEDWRSGPGAYPNPCRPRGGISSNFDWRTALLLLGWFAWGLDGNWCTR